MIYEDYTYESNISLTRTEAEFRAAAVCEVSYDVSLALPKGELYFGACVVKFRLVALPAASLYLDFRGLKICNLLINGNVVAGSVFANHQIHLPAAYLQIGENTVELEYLNKYRKDGVGLHSFTCRTEGYQYLYTQLAASFAHYVFPCFDQPDLKAPWTFKAIIPEDWIAISNDVVNDDKQAESGCLIEQMAAVASHFNAEDIMSSIQNPKVYWFRETPRISTYIYAFVVGPFDYFEHVEEGLPRMRIYARKSFKGDINHQEMFKVTKVGMRFYKDFFG